MIDARTNAGAAEPRRPNLWSRLKTRWGVTNWGMVAIILAFSLAGSTIVKIGRPIVDALLPDNTPRWLWWTVKIIVIIPIYEVILVTYGTILGQGRFFRDKQRRLLRFLARPFRER
jgi:hypothetical protein